MINMKEIIVIAMIYHDKFNYPRLITKDFLISDISGIAVSIKELKLEIEKEGFSVINTHMCIIRKEFINEIIEQRIQNDT